VTTKSSLADRVSHGAEDACRPNLVALNRSAADLRPLVDAAKAGDREALDELVRLTYSGTYTLAFRLTGHEDGV
jgi:hypothetical protein